MNSGATAGSSQGTDTGTRKNGWIGDSTLKIQIVIDDKKSYIFHTDDIDFTATYEYDEGEITKGHVKMIFDIDIPHTSVITQT